MNDLHFRRLLTPPVATPPLQLQAATQTRTPSNYPALNPFAQTSYR